jgi:hypothetical protein
MSIGSFGRIVSPKKIAQHHKLFFHAVRVAIVFAFNSRKNDLSSALADYSLGFSLVSSNTTPLIKRASGNKISSQSVYPALHIL